MSLRRRLLLSVIGAVALTLVPMLVVFNVVLNERLSHEADNALYARASAELASLRIGSGRLAAPELPDAAALDPQAWVFAGARLLEQPLSDAATERAVRSLNGGARRRRDLPAAHLRLYAVPVVERGRRLGTVVAQVSLAPYESSSQTALLGSIALGVAVLLVLAIASRSVISGALAPVARMTAQAADWSDADARMRFGMGPPRDELTLLAATLDALLDRVATSIRHEQQFSAELSHELRTPLASVIAETQLALRHGHSIDELRTGLEQVLEGAQQMSRTLDTLLVAARVELGGSHGAGDARSAADAAVRAHRGSARDRGVTITVEDTAPVAIGVDTEVAERILAPLVENACRHARTRVNVASERRAGSVIVSVEDDGPGVAETERERIFEPGWSDASGNGHGAGLGLPLARRLARAAGGDVTLARDRTAGARFTVRLPAG